MKQCPQCHKTYADDSLRFCLDDGSQLIVLGGGQTEAETVMSFSPANQVRIEIPQDKPSTPSFTPPPSYQIPQQPPAKGGSSILKILAIVLVVLFLLLGVMGFAGYLFYRSMGVGPDPANTNTANTANTASPTPSKTSNPGARQTPTPKWNETPGNKPANTVANTTGPPTNGTQVTAHSPGDGYLVLRSQPNSKSTEMTRIPHGSRLTLTNCKEASTTGAGNYGRWCTASYNGLSGWVFDAFVKY